MRVGCLHSAALSSLARPIAGAAPARPVGGPRPLLMPREVLPGNCSSRNVFSGARLDAVRSFRRHSLAGAAMALSYPEPTVFPAKGEHVATIILLHGLGDTAAGWASLAPMFSIPGTKFIFPTAPTRPITLNMGMRMTGWYDLSSLEKIDNEEDAEGIQESWRFIDGLVAKEEEAGIPSTRVIVAGFSQGGAIAMMAARSKRTFGGIVGLSTYMPLREAPELVSAENMATPTLMCHGELDTVVKYQYGVETAKTLQDLGANVTLKSYPGMAHEASLEELEAVKSFMKEVTESMSS